MTVTMGHCTRDQVGDAMNPTRVLLLTALLLMAGAAGADNRELLERLRIDHAAMVSAERDFHARRRGGNLDGVEASDYAAYIARLHRRVAEDCVALSAAGQAVPAELSCPSVPPPALAPAAIDQAGERTGDEQIAVLDAELMGGLGEFDEMLLREQERVRAAAVRTQTADAGAGGAGAAGEDGAGAGSEGSDGAQGSDAEFGEASEQGGDRSTGRGDVAAGGAQRQPGRQGVPPDIPDGSDDDVVARQLREAAEKEQDPELKKRLWEEYRRYKEGTR